MWASPDPHNVTLHLHVYDIVYARIRLLLRVKRLINCYPTGGINVENVTLAQLFF